MDAQTDRDNSGAEASATLIVVPVMDAVLLPGTIMPLAITRPAAAAALQDAARTERHVVIILQREPFSDLPGRDDLCAIGTEARLLRYFIGRDGSHDAIMQGIGRVRIDATLDTGPYPAVTVYRIAEPEEHGAEIDARMHQVRERSLEILAMIEQAPAELAASVRAIEAAGSALADFVAGLLDLHARRKAGNSGHGRYTPAPGSRDYTAHLSLRSSEVVP